MQNKMKDYRMAAQIALLLILICISSVMIFRFFRTNLIQENFREVKRIESVVLRIYAREYQRIFLLVQSIQQLDGLAVEQLRDALESLVEGYGVNGQIPYLIKDASLIMERETLKKGEFQIQTVFDDETGMNESILLHRPEERDDLLIRVELDREGFDQHYIQPAVEESLPEYSLEWISLSPDDVQKSEIWANPRDFIDENKIRFHPLSALIGWHHNEDTDLYIQIPGTFENRHPFKIDDRERTENLNESSEVAGRDIKDRFFDFRPGFDPLNKTGRVVSIGFDNAPYYAETEKKAAIIWLLSNLVLLGTGFIFLVLILQMKRLKTLRTRENEFVASMTHELRTPLTVLQSAADNLSAGIIEPEKTARYGKMMKDQVKRLSSMVEEILLFSSMEGSHLKPGFPIDLRMKDLIEEMKNSMEPIAGEKNIPVYWDLEGFPEIVKGYPEETRLILSNLINNAVTHAYPDSTGPVRILVRFNISGTLQMTVEDEGRGISPGDQKKIFTPFYRTLYSREQQIRGSGLGLHIAKRKADILGGSLHVESPYKRLDGQKMTGCRFVLKIPCTCSSREGK